MVLRVEMFQRFGENKTRVPAVITSTQACTKHITQVSIEKDIKVYNKWKNGTAISGR